MNTSISSPQNFLKPSLVFEIAARSANTHQITAKERNGLRTAFLENPLNEEEHRIIDRIYRALRRGHLQMV